MRSCYRLVALVVTLLALSPSAQTQPGQQIVRGPYLQSPTPSSIVVRWRSALPSDSRVAFGTDPQRLDREVSVAGSRIDHEVRLDALEPETRHYYAVGDALGVSGGEDHTFVTPPAPGSRRPVRVWIFGDSGWGATPGRGHADEMRDGYLAFAGERPADVWILLGDNAYVAGTDAEYQSHLFDLFAGELRRTPVWSTFGNHENFFAWSRREDCAAAGLPGDECGPYYELFTFPVAGEAGGVASGREAWHSFDHGNVHFVNLDSQDADRSPGSPMLTWLEEDLAANEQEWTIVYFHHPVYSAGTHPSDTDTGEGSATPPTAADDFAIQEMRAHVLPILEAHGVDLVLMAHSHNYERSYLLDGHYGTSETLDESMKLGAGDGRPDGDGPYRKRVGIFDDAHSGTVYAVVGTGAEAAVAGEHPAIAAREDRVGSLVVDVDGPRLEASFVDVDGVVHDRFAIVRGVDNVAPLARPDAVSTAPGTPVTIAVLDNDVDPDGDLLAVESVSAPALGSAVIDAGGAVVYTPGPGVAAGEDVFAYTVGDGAGGSASAPIRVTIACPPLADGVFADDLEPEPEPGWSVDTAVNDNPLSATWQAREEPSARSPVHAWFSESSDTTLPKDDRLVAPPLDLSVHSRLVFWHRYHFEQGFDGGVLEISTDGGVTWSDLGGSIVEGGYAPQQIFVDGVPRAAWTGFSGEAMSRVEVDLGAYAGEGRRLRWRLVADLFTPEETLGWLVDDVEVGALVSGPGDCNLPPIARDDEAGTTEGEPVSIAVLANDSDPDGDPLAVTAVGAAQHGAASDAGDGTVTYAPDPGFAGLDLFTYTISDGRASAEATVRVSVEAAGGPRRARGNGWVADGRETRFGFHARRKDDAVKGWLRLSHEAETDEEELELDAWVRELRFTTGGATLEGIGWLGDGRKARFVATVEAGKASRGEGRFAVELYDDGGELLLAVDGPLASGRIVFD